MGRKYPRLKKFVFRVTLLCVDFQRKRLRYAEVDLVKLTTIIRLFLKGGLQVMAQINANSALIKAALLKGLRVGLFFKHDDTVVEYHFIRDPRDEEELNLVTCVMYTSTTSDPLRLCGTTHPIKDFMAMVSKSIIHANYTTPYQRTDVRLYPGDWYPCFETNPDQRIAQVTKIIASLEETSRRIADEDRKILEEENKRREAEQKRREEELKKLEESRAAQSARRIPHPSINGPTNMRAMAAGFPGSGRLPHPLVLSADASDDDISEMLARGFFGNI